MLSRKNLYRLLLLAVILALLAVPVLSISLDSLVSLGNPGAAADNAYSNGVGAESTQGPTAIANDCNGGSGGGCGGG